MSTEVPLEAARALLGGGFVTGPEATAVRRARRPLADLFRDEFGWQVVAEDHGPVRALCLPGASHVARGLASRSRRPFDSTRYSLLFLVLACLESAGARTTLQVLFEGVATRAADIDALVFDRNEGPSRRAFVHAVRAVADLGVLELAEGNEESFASRGEGDALYRVERERLTRLLATSKPPSLAMTPETATAENLYAHTEDGQRRHRRHRVTRALVSEPVVYRSDLTDGEIEYLNGQEQRLRRLLRDTFGLTLETRAEGWVAVDAEGGLTDESFPALSTPRAAALAVVDASRARRSPNGTCVWSADELAVFVAGLHSRFSNWPLGPGDEDGAAKLAVDAAQVLVTMRLARPADDGVLVVLAASGRFALAESPDSASDTDMGGDTDQSSDGEQPAPAGLFDQETTP